MKVGGVNLSPSSTHRPEVCMSATYHVLPSGEIFTSCGIGCAAGRCSWPMTSCRAVSTLSRSPENSQLAMKYRPSGEKSTWLTPSQLTFTVFSTAMVCASRNTIWCAASDITTAYFPSGVKYRLYGSLTGIGAPNFPVAGSIGVSALPRSLLTYRVRRSQDGTTCSGLTGTLTVWMTLYVVGSMTDTLA